MLPFREFGRDVRNEASLAEDSKRSQWLEKIFANWH